MAISTRCSQNHKFAPVPVKQPWRIWVQTNHTDIPITTLLPQQDKARQTCVIYYGLYHHTSNISGTLWYVYTYTDPTRTPLNCCPWRTTPLISAKFTAGRDTDNAHGYKTVVTWMQHGCSRTWHGRQTDMTRTARKQCGYDTNVTRTARMKHGHDTAVIRTW